MRRVFHQIDRRLCNLSELLNAYNPKEYEGEEEVIQQSLATNLAFVEGIQELFHSAYLKRVPAIDRSKRALNRLLTALQYITPSIRATRGADLRDIKRKCSKTYGLLFSM